MMMPWYFLCSLILFSFRNNGNKEHLDWNDFRHCYGVFFFEKGILKVTSSQLCSKHLLNNDEVNWRYPKVIYGHGSAYVLNILSRLWQTWNKNQWKRLEKDQLHKNSRVHFEENFIDLNTPGFTYFIRFFFSQT